MAIVAEGNRQRDLPAADCQSTCAAAEVPRPEDVPDSELAHDPRWLSQRRRYGMTQFADLFTNRQLTALTTFSDLVGEARDRCCRRRRWAAAATPDAGGTAPRMPTRSRPTWASRSADWRLSNSTRARWKLDASRTA